MAEWADLYKNIQQPDPMKQAGEVFSVLNSAQGLALAKQAHGAGKTAKAGAQYLGQLSDKGTATKFAKLVSASGGPAKDEVIKILSDAQAAKQNKSLIPSLLRLAAP